MTTVLIADSCKPSLVMTSEIFKDKIAGTEVLVAATGKEALDFLVEAKPDLCVVDFDLPDVDGPALVEAMRKCYNGPILMTAYPDDMVAEAVNTHLFAFNDASDWVAKPVTFDKLSEKIDRFMLEGHRLGKRFISDIETQLIGKASGRGKRAPKVGGKLINLSLGGACVQLEAVAKMKKTQEITVSFHLPKKAPAKKAKTTKVTKKAKATKTTKPRGSETKIKAKIAWVSGKKLGLQFAKLSDPQRRGLESFFKATD